MIGDFSLDDADFQISMDSRGPRIDFSKKVEEELNFD